MSAIEDLTQTTRSVDAGAMIFEEGSRGTVAYFIISGTVEIFSDSDDGEIVLARLEEGQLFGEMALLDQGYRSASARAVDDTMLRVLRKDALLSHLADDPNSAMSVMKRLTDRVRTANERIVSSSLTDPINETDEERAHRAEASWLDRLLPWRVRTKAIVAEFQPDVIELENRPVPAAAIITLYAILAFIGAALIWSYVSKVDTFVSVGGRLTTTVSNIIVQPRETAVIRTFNVKVGDVVSEGQVLATLDSTFAEADLNANRSTLSSLNGQIARLESELSADEPKFFSESGGEESLQRQIFGSRRDEFKAKILGFDKEVAQLEQQITNIAIERKFIVKRVAVLRELEEAHEQLLTRKAVSRVQFLATQDNRIGMELQDVQLRNRAKNLINISSAKRAEKQVFVSQWRTEIAEKVVELRRQRDTVVEQLKKLEYRGKNVEIAAPAAGVVLELGNTSVGSMIREADPLLTLVPLDVPLEAEIDIDPKNISRVVQGLPVRIKLEALPFQKHGTVNGKLRYVSEDTYDRTIDGEKATIYRGRVDVDDRSDLKALPPNFRLIPGMSVSADIVVGQRRLITYFVYPIARWLDSSFREP